MATLRQTLEAYGFRANGLGGNLRGYVLEAGGAEYVITAERNVARLPVRWDEGLRLTMWRDCAPYRESVLQGFDAPTFLADYGIAPR